MTTIHITDACKPSLVMTSEVFKDKIPGSIVLFAPTGKDCVEFFSKVADPRTAPDICIVDFDLPDTDGVTLIREMRKFYNGPILLTAYPDKIVEIAVKDELFAFNDAFAWIPKPVRFDELEKRIDQFLINHHRLGRRFDVDFATNLIGKGAGRGKRAPKVQGRIVNISLGGVCVEVEQTKFKLKNGEEFSFVLDLSAPPPAAEKASVKASPKKTPTTKAKSVATGKKRSGELLKGKIAWIKDGGKSVGVEFHKMSDVQRRGLEMFLKGLNA